MKAMMLIAVALLAAPAGAQSVKAGVEAWGRGDLVGALAIWRPLAAKGDPDAMFNLGQAYRLGRGVPIDLAQAQGWYERAARSGHADAQAQLGMLLFQGGNRVAGLRWLKTAADNGEARAQLLYGTALYNGDGVPRDPVAAYRYVAKSAAQGLAPAQATLEQLDATMPAAMRQPVPGPAPKPRTTVVATSKPPIARPVSKPGPAAAPPSATAVGGNWRVQLGAFSQRAAAQALFARLAAGPLAGKSPVFVAVGPIIRLQAGPYASRWAATAACGKLTARGQPCFAVPAR